jgi:hypothetical protein
VMLNGVVTCNISEGTPLLKWYARPISGLITNIANYVYMVEHHPVVPTWYILEVTCDTCTVRDSILVQVNRCGCDDAYVDAGPDVIVAPGDITLLHNYAPHGCETTSPIYRWYENTISPAHLRGSVQDSLWLRPTVTNRFIMIGYCGPEGLACADTDTVVVTVAGSVELPIKEGDDAISNIVQYFGAAPNPFTQTTIIRFSVPKAMDVSLQVFDSRGRLVRSLINQKLERGIYRSIWEGHDDTGFPMKNGVYFVRLVTDEKVETSKLLFVR